MNIRTLIRITASERAKLWYRHNKDNPKFKLKQKERLIEWRLKYPERYIYQRAKDRASLQNIPFEIEVEDIIIPEVCPVFKTPFVFGTPYAASLDKIDPVKGYIKGNIQVISRKANAMKRDASKEELRKFAQWAIKTFQV